MTKLEEEISDAINKLSDKDIVDHEACCRAAAAVCKTWIEKALEYGYDEAVKEGRQGHLGSKLGLFLNRFFEEEDHAGILSGRYIAHIWVKKIAEIKLVKDEAILLMMLANLRAEAKALLENKRV